MEEQTRKRLDSVLEDELQRGFRIKELPQALQKQLDFECGVAISRVRFTRLNPAKRRKVAEVVQRQYHRDLQNPDVLSREQILKLVQDRGEWSAAMEEEMQRLQERTSREMGLLYASGDEHYVWTDKLLTAADSLRSLVDELVDDSVRKDTLARFDRWFEYSEEKEAEYTAKYALDQERERYSADHDLQRLLLAFSDVRAAEALNTIDDLREKLQRYMRLQRDRLRLADLQLRNAKIFADCAEQRRDNAEEMARLFFTTERVDDTDKPQGPLVPEFDALWNFPEEVIQWFLVEAYFFLNGIPDDAREYLKTYGFLGAEAGETTTPSGESEQSGASPAPQSSKPDSESVEVTESDSSESVADTTLTTDK
jgi:hypothetical protein